ncbi:uncharacterized protein LDX57_005347 [Aspergillus melleus]|uniref:uncharacterized protein n=1 Tax=Aspergillus melleus TaxID=138277 RepID=UPI001E8EC32F|nr:uncharacterized protein LDX57_005347 [Aspergillus melleus]KAH8427636.1 hypothetical protein LDX57_005347 [Aspergillus melleus]
MNEADPDLTKQLGLGVFEPLPEEVRAIIWKKLMPRGKTDMSEPAHRYGKLSILRASRILHDEVIALLYKKSMLTLDFCPENAKWVTIIYRCFGQEWPGKKEIVKSAFWHINDPFELHSRGFANFPFWRLQLLEVIAQEPNRRFPRYMFWLVVKATLVFRILHRAFETEGLFIRNYAYTGRGVFKRPSFRPGYGIMCRSSEALQQIKSLYMRFYQNDVQYLMEDMPLAVPAYGGNYLKASRTINHWLHSQKCFWNYPCDANRHGLRAEWVRSALTQNDSSFFEFHRYYWEISTTNPHIIEDYNRAFEAVLMDMHVALVSLYNFVIERDRRPERPPLRPGHHVFRRMVPADLMDVQYDMDVESNYREYMHLYGYRYEDEDN